MIPTRLAVTCGTIMTTVLLSACTADPSKDDAGRGIADETSSTRTPTSEPTDTSSSEESKPPGRPRPTHATR